MHVCPSCLRIPDSISKGALPGGGNGEVAGKREEAQGGPCPSTGVWMGTAEKVLDQQAQNKLTIKCVMRVTLVIRSP